MVRAYVPFKARPPPPPPDPRNPSATSVPVPRPVPPPPHPPPAPGLLRPRVPPQVPPLRMAASRIRQVPLPPRLAYSTRATTSKLPAIRATLETQLGRPYSAFTSLQPLLPWVQAFRDDDRNVGFMIVSFEEMFAVSARTTYLGLGLGAGQHGGLPRRDTSPPLSFGGAALHFGTQVPEFLLHLRSSRPQRRRRPLSDYFILAKSCSTESFDTSRAIEVTRCYTFALKVQITVTFCNFAGRMDSCVSLSFIISFYLALV